MYLKLTLLLIITSTLNFSEPPWGQDADITYIPEEHLKKQTLPQLISQSVIKFHQKVISPADGPRSHFYPSSSQYMFQAISKYGFLKGYIIGCDRLQRENSDEWVYRKILRYDNPIKYDPVP